MRVFRLVMLCATAVGSLCAAELSGLTIASVFTDHAVLQRDQVVPIWGKATAGVEVVVQLGDRRLVTNADAGGRWQVDVQPLPASAEPVAIVVTSGDQSVTVSDILVGEVWLCSGQSNMEWAPNWGIDRKEEEIAAANYPHIRLLKVGKDAAEVPRERIAGSWKVCSPESLLNFSAVGYFYGRELHTALQIPVGLIASSWGGTPAQSWASYAALAADPALAGYAKGFDEAMAAYPEAKRRHEELLANPVAEDKIIDAGWQATELDVTEWKTMELPQPWEKAGLAIDGTVWFRRTVELPADVANHDVALSLGPIDDADITYWDGTEIGHMDSWNQARHYTIPAALASAGTHTIAVRVVDTGGGGGFFGKPEDLVATTAGGTAVPLNGTWIYRVSENIAAKPSAPMGPGHPWLPTSLRNGMITPLIPYAIRGVIWYQGESNTGQAWQYRTLFPAMIADWRQAWGMDFPFYFVQLANFMAVEDQPGESNWAELRDAQLYTVKTVPNTGMAVIIDIGMEKNIHPTNKRDVGKRLAQWALADIHKQDVVASGPLYREAVIEDGKIRIHFDQIGGGLVAHEGHLTRFAIAGEDRQWVWADAVIDGDTVVVSHRSVLAPVAVRYAWANNPAGCNLYNAAGLPASPFRTDDWPLITNH